jgi:hypothetical protein
VNNHVTRNVAANARLLGQTYFQVNLGTIKLPTGPGADPSVSGTAVDAYSLPILEDRDNELYGSMDFGLDYWWVGSYGQTYGLRATADSVIANLRVWHVYHYGVYNYQASRIVLDRPVMRGDMRSGAGLQIGIFGGDYLADRWEIRAPDIQGMRQGVQTSVYGTQQTIRGGYLRNRWNIVHRTLYTSAASAHRIIPRNLVVEGTVFAVPAVNATGYRAVVMEWSDVKVRNLIQTDAVTVNAFNGAVGDNVRIFYTQQAPAFLVPQTQLNSLGEPAVLGAPVSGLTNTQTWAQYGIALGGEIANCTATDPTVTGLVCRIDPCVATPLVVTVDGNFPLASWSATDTRGCTVTK